MSKVTDQGVAEDWCSFPVRRYTIRGRVQGVGFRWWTQREACSRNLVGSVWNREDGDVVIVAGGEPFFLDAFAQRLREGPPAARVDSIDEEPVVPGSIPVPHSFEIVRIR